MKRKIYFSGIAMVSLAAILILTQCAKSFNGSTAGTILPPGPGLPPPPPTTPPTCPFDCHDSRCKMYINYCGLTLPVNYQMVSLSSAAVTGTMTRAFEAQNINWAVLSAAAGLPATIQESDIDFQNLYKSYDANDLSGAQAYTAPFKSNSNTNASNYVFALYSSDGVCFKEPMIIKIKMVPKLSQYFDLTDGSILSVSNYDSTHPATSIDSSGSFLINSTSITSSGKSASMNKMVASTMSSGSNLTTNALGSPCGQKTMNCISDVYSNHGWLSVWATVQTAFIPATAAAFAAACAAKNCLGSTKSDQACYN
jgi:hypothetical protein